MKAPHRAWQIADGADKLRRQQRGHRIHLGVYNTSQPLTLSQSSFVLHTEHNDGSEPTMCRCRRCQRTEGYAGYQKSSCSTDIQGWYVGLSYSEIAAKLGKSEQHVIDSKFTVIRYGTFPTDVVSLVCTGASTPTADEFKALAQVLDIKDSVR